MQIWLRKYWKHISNLLKNYSKDWSWWSSDSKRLFVRESPELESPAQYKLTYHPNIWDRAPGGGSGHAAFKLMKYGTTASNQCDDIGGQCPCLCGHQTHPTLTQKTVSWFWIKDILRMSLSWTQEHVFFFKKFNAGMKKFCVISLALV